MSKTISTNELRSMLQAKSDVLVLDVLPKAAFDKDHIEGAHNVPMDAPNFLRDVDRLTGSKNKKIVVYCASDSCDTSANAADKLTAAGHTDVLKYEAGIAGWRKQGTDRTAPTATSKPKDTGVASEGKDRGAPKEQKDQKVHNQGKSGT